MDLPKVIGHRGAAAVAPENTLVGLRAAAAAGVRVVEFDVKLTADGRCVLFHDGRLERTTNGHGRVAETTFAEMARLDAGSWFAAAFAGERVPSLEAALALVAELDLFPALEIKPCAGRETVTAEAVMGVVAACWPKDRPLPLITSFKPESLAVARALAPAWPRGLNMHTLIPAWRRRVDELGCAFLSCNHRYLRRRQAAAVVASGVPLLAFTVNNPARAETLRDWGVSTLITDAPDRILPVVEGRASVARRDRGAGPRPAR